MTDVTLRWVAATDASATTAYTIETDVAESGTFVYLISQAATNRGDGVYSPFSTCISSALTASGTIVDLETGTNFAGSSYIAVEKEMIKLGASALGSACATYTSCSRGYGGTMPLTHAASTLIYAAHESYAASPNFGSRYAVRYKVRRIEGSSSAIGTEILALNPPTPPFTNLCTVYGVLEGISGSPISGTTVSLALDENDNYGQDTSELIKNATVSTTTDADGFFSLFVRRDLMRQGAGNLTLTVGDLSWAVETVPDEDNVNFLRT